MRNEQTYYQVKRIGALIRLSESREEALKQVREAFPDEDLTELVKHMSDYLTKKM